MRCKGVINIEREFEHRLTEVEARSKSNVHRLDEVEKRQDDLDELVGTVKVLAVREESVEKDVKEIKSDVKNIKSIPTKRWEQIITLVIAAAVGYFLSKIGF